MAVGCSPQLAEQAPDAAIQYNNNSVITRKMVIKIRMVKSKCHMLNEQFNMMQIINLFALTLGSKTLGFFRTI